MNPASIPFRFLKSAAMIACLSAVAPSAFAQAFDVVRLFGAAPGEDGRSVGVTFISAAEYQGSRDRRNMILPSLMYQWANGWFAGTSNGIGYNFSKDPALDVGLRLTVDLGRKESASSALNGMGDVDIKPTYGGFLNYSLTPEFTLTSSLRYGSGNASNGMVIDVGAAYSTQLAPSWRTGFGVSTSYVNAAYMQDYFGVTPGQSLTSGYAAYSPGAGFRDVRASASLTYFLNPRTVVTGALSGSALQGGAKDSPLTQKTTFLSGVVQVSYGF
jgi:outer membrane protein